MLRLRARLLPLVLVILLPLWPGATLAAPARFDPDARLDWPLPVAHILPVSILGQRHTLPRVRLFTAEITILASGKFVTRTIAARPYRPDHGAPAGMHLIVLPLPAAMPLFLLATAGLVLTGRRRAGARLAGAGRAA